MERPQMVNGAAKKKDVQRRAGVSEKHRKLGGHRVKKAKIV